MSVQDSMINPQEALPFAADMKPAKCLTADQVSSWQERGFCLVNNVLPESLVDAVVGAAQSVFPAPNSKEATERRDFGSDGMFEFPTEYDPVNEVTLHPRLVTAVAQLLDCSPMNLRLTQSDLWAKYGKEIGADAYDNQDQRMHCDYPNHMLTHPPPFDSPEAVEIIIYFSEETECGGGTAVVARDGSDDPAYTWPIINMPGVSDIPYINDKKSAETYLEKHKPDIAEFRSKHLYPREKRAAYAKGTVLFYRHDTWHRGTPLKPNSCRYVMNLTFRTCEAVSVNILQRGWSWAMYRRSMSFEKLIASCSVTQRTLLGFPPPGHPYWSSATLLAVQARYSALGMDMDPYWDAFKA